MNLTKKLLCLGFLLVLVLVLTLVEKRVFDRDD